MRSRSPGSQSLDEQRLAGPHPVAVALDGVDLAVVGDVAVRVGQRPRRERVGREPRVDERQRRLDALVDEVGEELGELGRGEHALVDERAARQRREVDAAVLGDRRRARARSACARCRPGGRASRRARPSPARNSMRNDGLDGPGRVADHRVVDGDVAPAEDPQALAGGDLLDALGDLVGPLGVAGQEGDARGVPSPRGAGRSRRPPAGSGPASGSGCRRRRRCSPRCPSAPRCSRLQRAPMPCWTISWLRRPFMWTTKETPQASCSKAGS